MSDRTDGGIAVDAEKKDRITVQSEEDRRILETLAELGGGKMGDDDVLTQGTKLILPENMTPKAAIKFLKGHIESQEKEHEFSRTFKFRPLDGANAVDIALRRVTGSAGLGASTYGFFGMEFPPEMRTIDVGFGKTKQVPWGAMKVPMFEGVIQLGDFHHPDLGRLFRISLTAPKKFRIHIEGFFDVVQDVLENESIFKGQAIDGSDGFIDLSKLDPTKTIYSQHVKEQLEANVWSLLRHSQVMRDNDLPLKRAVLTHGPYGSGKTLAAFQTAQIAVENEWTFLYCRPGKDKLETVMQTARLYQPAVVFFEDVDEIAQPDTDETDDVTRLLDLFDGIAAKNTELVAVMTTNHVERIHKGMVRPGRLDAVIEIAGLDAEGIQQLVRAIAGDTLQEPIAWDEVVAAMSGYLPAFIREAVDRAKRYALATRGEVRDITTADLVAAAEGLREQLDLMEAAEESKEIPYIDKAFRHAGEKGGLAALSQALENGAVELQYNDGDKTGQRLGLADGAQL